MFSYFLQGVLIGLAIAAPIGPTGILCIQRSLHGGFTIGFMTGIGAALADGTYGIIVGFGLTAISGMLMQYQYEIRFVGGLFLLYLAASMAFATPTSRAQDVPERSAWHALLTSYVMTMTNPATVLAFVAVFAGLGVGASGGSYSQASMIVLGITLGSGAWWLSLSSTVSLILHHRLSPVVMRRINRVSGAILAIFGVLALLPWGR